MVLPGIWELMILLILGLLFIVPMWLCIRLAGRKNRDRVVWGVMGLVFSWLGVIVLACLKPRTV